MNSLNLAILDLKRLWRSPFARLAAIVVCFLPLLYSFLYLYAFWDPYHDLSVLKVAVVNYDRKVIGGSNTINAGQDLVNKLKTDHSIGWVFTTEQDAKSGLADGKYTLALIIPADFSQEIYNTSKEQARKAYPPAKLYYYSNPSNNFLAEQIGAKVMTELKGEVNGQIAGDFLDNVFGSLSDMKSKLQTAANGSSLLTDALQQAHDGSAKIAGNLQTAYGGSRQAVSGATSAASGARSLQNGLSQLQSGAGQLQNGTQQLNAGLTSLKSGLNDSQQGVPALISGSQQIADGTASLNSGTAAAVQQLITGAKAASSGVESVSSGVQTAGQSIALISGSLSSQLAPGLNQDNKALLDAIAKLQTAVKGTSVAADPNYLNALAELQAVQASLDPSSASGLTFGLNSAVAGLNQVQSGLIGNDPANPSASLGLSSINAALQNPQNPNDQNTLVGGLNSLSSTLSANLNALQNGAVTLTGGLTTLQSQTNSGLNNLIAGSSLAASGAASLDSGIIKANSGSSQLSSGLQTLSNGAQNLQSGLGKLQQGSSTLTSSLGKMYSGGNELLSGLQAGINKLQADLPHNPSGVAKVMGRPVETHETQIYPVKNYGAGLSPYFIPLSLWVGALMLFFVVNTKDNRLASSGISRLSRVLGKLGTLGILGILQAVIYSFVLTTILGLHPTNMLEFYGFNIFLSWTFISIMFLLVKTTGMVGRFLAIVLLMLQLTSCGGTFPIQLVPHFFQVISPWLPMTYGTAALRHIIGGSSSIPFTTSIAVLALYLAITVIISIVTTPTSITISDLHPAPELGA